jgi:hypothetical protein
VGALDGGGHDDREDAPGHVGAAGGGVVVGGVVERLDGELGGVGHRHAGPVALLERRVGEQRTGADRVVAVLLVGAAGDVVAEDAAGPRRVARGEVDAAEDRHDGEALHGGAEVAPDHRGEPVGLAVEGQHRALDLLVVLELHLEQADQLDADAGRAGDADQRVGVGGMHLLDVALGDEVAHGGPPVAGHDHAAVGHDRHDRGGVRGQPARGAGGQRPAAGQQIGVGGAQELGEGGGADAGVDIRQTPGRIKTQSHVLPLRVD